MDAFTFTLNRPVWYGATTPSERYAILDYIFRELAVSYLGRHDLAHVDVSEVANTGLGSSDEELEENREPPPAAKYLSRGLLRGQESRVFALRSSSSAVAVAAVQTDPDGPVASLQHEVATAFQPAKVRMDSAMGALTALQEEQTVALADRWEGWRGAAGPARCAGQGAGGQGQPGGRPTRRGEGEGLRGRKLRGVRQLHLAAQRHLHEVRHLRRHQRLQLSHECPFRLPTQKSGSAAFVCSRSRVGARDRS